MVRYGLDATKIHQYYPKQYQYGDLLFTGECLLLWDRNEEYSIVGVEIGEKHQNFFNRIAPTLDEAKILILTTLAKWIRKDYPYARKRKPKQIVQQIWWTGK